MKLTENTKVRVKVPKHLYEAIQAELDKKGEMEEAKKEMSHGLLQKMVDDLLAKYGETEQMKSDILIALRAKANDMLNNMHPQLKSKFREEEVMEEGEEMNEYVGMSPDQAELVNNLGQLIASGAASAAVIMAAKSLLSMLKSKKSGDAKAPTEPEITAEEIEEAFDLNTLMEAVKDASKKKAEDKKKKELEAKKKKAEDDKKKKEAEAKKKAVAAKKK